MIFEVIPQNHIDMQIDLQKKSGVRKRKGVKYHPSFDYPYKSRTIPPLASFELLHRWKRCEVWNLL
jgi:hypothetical protein